MTKFYQLTTTDVLDKLLVDSNRGLSNQQVLENRNLYGTNKLSEKKEDPAWKIFLKGFKEPIVIVLIGAIFLSLLSSFYAFNVQNEPQHGKEALYEAIAIFILVIINASIVFFQEMSTKKSLDALKEMDNRTSVVLRDHEWQTIPTSQIVVGDIIKVKMGDFVEADVRWIKSSELQVIESHLTGEADAISKDTSVISEDTQLADRNNMGYSGSTVSNGQGIGVVVGIGDNTEMGNIATLIQNSDTKTSPLQVTIKKLTSSLMKISLAVVILTFIIGIIKAGELSIASITSVLSTSISLAVASIPDAMPIVLSIVLTIGATKTAANNGLIKSLNSVETLGSTSYICSDKTGTLTQNQMTVTNFYDGQHSYKVSGLGYEPVGEIKAGEINFQADDSLFIKGSVLCNEASVKEVNGKFKPFGNPTEIALNVLGQKAGVTKESLKSSNKIMRTLPFTSDRKMMSVVVETPTAYRLYTKGAPDVLLKNSQNILLNNKIVSSSNHQQFSNIVDEYATKALRTLAVAYRDLTQKEAQTSTIEELEQQLTIVGVAGIIDPPRPEVKKSVKTLNDAKIEVVMITGDHAKTARAIAYDLGIVKSKNAVVISGSEIEKMSDDELFNSVLKTNIYARVTPEHKQRIIKQLQRQRQIVAMTGDGVNDAPALKAADIGIAMGITGTEVTKDSADLILLDDKFTTIEKSVRSGRMIYANIKNFMRHELTTNVAEVMSLLFGLFFTQSIGQVTAGTATLTALMVLWVNMISDSLPSFALGYDVAESDIMKEKPRDVNESILANHTWSRVLIRGTIMGAMVYLAFYWAARNNFTPNQAQTAAFLTLVFGQLWHVFDARSSKSIFRRNPFENKHLLVAVLFAGISSILVTAIPFFNLVMGTAQLPRIVYLWVIFIPAIPTFVLSGLKEIFKIKIW
ncbi:cation-translocating P-type ATPase [Companilactobacillus halodurans]|uniref:Cation-transporting P-type ATPase n=1 Tax=Companilactobacillus halodurans TaxID=2584183 RepID=A0A5P0ZPF7_9LACO|nr:cation-transporting P-type ATPase [Companilactobacillus halodurans]MQS76134.1 cation-transporting P-type ATPase [Companilactobacillus halodurans]MQS96707.1 cation-transporting P-type ATPase [Companilactobacillus halodurans]